MNDDSTAQHESLGYRPCVGVMLINADNRVWVGQRIDMVAEAWQMPQGGIDPGEEPLEAALRELEEEIGTAKAEPIAETRGWLRYDLPDHLHGKLWGGRYRGQEQKWFLMRFLGPDADIDIATKHPEFAVWDWVEPERLPDLIVPFKRDLYRRVLDEFRPILSGER